MPRTYRTAEPALPPSDDFSRLIASALERRMPVARVTDAYRVVDDQGDGLPGVVVDRYADFAVLSLFSEAAALAAEPLADALIRTGICGVYAKRRIRADARRASKEAAPEAPLRGEAALTDLIVTENGMKLHVDLEHGLSTGLFTDQRDTRAWVRASAKGARVLNLFAYTCSFTVAAALGGAAATTSVDLSQRSLSRGHQNLVVNGVDGSIHRLLKGDALSFLKRARRRGDRFDLVVLDPPTFGTLARGTFSVERDFATAAEDALALIAPGGSLVAVTNHLGTSRNALHALVRNAARSAGAPLEGIRDLPPPIDHRHRPGGNETVKTVIASVARARTPSTKLPRSKNT